MTDKYFIDTNFFVYLFNEAQKEKHIHCVNLLSYADSNLPIALSTQVLKEFAYVMKQKFNWSPLQINNTLDILNGFEVAATPVDTIKKAIEISFLNQLSFWDSLIVGSAIHTRSNIILTEDLNDGQIIQGIKIVNPFSIDRL